MRNLEKFDKQIASQSLAMTEVLGVTIVPLCGTENTPTTLVMAMALFQRRKPSHYNKKGHLDIKFKKGKS